MLIAKTMEKYKGACNIFICLGIGILMAAIVFAYLYTQKKNGPREATCQPGPVAESPLPCVAGDVSATVAFDAGAGNIYGALSIKNTSAKTCTIAGNNFPQLNYDQTAVKNLNVINQGLPSVKQYAIAPEAAVYARIHFPNGPQCGEAISTVNATLTYEIAPGTVLTFENVPPQGGTAQPSFGINACAGTDITSVEITNLSDQVVP
jgi:hypothetical protein